MATTTNHYDLIVLGNDLAGLVAAALASRRGKRVLVIPQGPPGGRYRLGGKTYPLNTAPVVHMSTPVARRVWTELGLAQQVRRQHAPISHRIHFVWPSGRVDLTPAGANLPHEAARVWPHEPEASAAWALAQRWADATDEVLDPLLTSETALVAEGFWSRRFLSRVNGQLPAADVDEMAPLPADHPLRRVSEGVLPWLQHLDPAKLGKAAGLRLRGLWGRGPEDLPGGEAALRTLLLQRIELHSGEVKPELRVAELRLRRGRVAGVSLLGKRDRYGCDHLIVATDPAGLADGPLVPESMPRPLLERLQTIRPRAHRFIMHLELDARGLSPALDAMAVCLPDGPGPAGSTFVRLLPGSSEEVRHVCVAHVVDPATGLGDLRECLLDQLDGAGVLPFCHDHVRWVHSPHDGRAVTTAGGARLADHPAPSSAHPMEPLYTLAEPASLGMGVLPQASGLRGLHIACRLTLPGLGLEGELAAGAIAAGAVVGPARSPFSRSPLLSRA